jgi:hypothetical protein
MEIQNETAITSLSTLTVSARTRRLNPAGFLCPKETAPARGRAEGRLTSGYAGAPQHSSDCELKFCFRAGYFGVPSAKGRFRICVLTEPVGPIGRSGQDPAGFEHQWNEWLKL